MTDGRDPKISLRLPAEMKDALDELSEQYEIDRSALVRHMVTLGLERNEDALAIETEIAEERRRIIKEGKPIDLAGGFASRVRRDFEERFKNGYDPEWLIAKAETYRDEAEMLEEKVADHKDAPPIEEDELVDTVDEVLGNVLEATAMSDWDSRYDNPMARFSGVESGREAREFALVLTKNAMRRDEEVSELGSAFGTTRRVRAEDLPELADKELPPEVTREDVARVARQLRDADKEPDDVATDPDEFDPFDGELPALGDGGKPSEEPDAGDLVEWAAETLRDPELSDERVQEHLDADTQSWQNTVMDQSTLTVDELLELADDYNAQRSAALTGERDGAPQAVADGSGGVAVE